MKTNTNQPLKFYHLRLTDIARGEDIFTTQANQFQQEQGWREIGVFE